MGNNQSKNGSDSEFKSNDKRKKQAKSVIKGYARRKGEHDPRNYGWAITDELATGSRWKDSTDLPPVGGYKKDKDGLTQPQKNKAQAEGFAQGWAAATAQQRGSGGGDAVFIQPGGGFVNTTSQQGPI